ncbi:hypothetical protein GQ55_9G158800 [Panicum hallii var. hallii]|uniref:Uncharacterized protein n=1 Tax=Panicum hallii var. hallii TaxID=1504633 RepID=A0A2T7C3Z2_9POAL|nr:hypothetical protein GQ55_9G158800 [Panicum hallii var. hallii]
MSVCRAWLFLARTSQVSSARSWCFLFDLTLISVSFGIQITTMSQNTSDASSFLMNSSNFPFSIYLPMSCKNWVPQTVGPVLGFQ